MTAWTRRLAGVALLAAGLVVGGGWGRAAAQRGHVRLLDWIAPVAAGWVSQPVASSMRLAQFDVPATHRAGAAQAVVYYFGDGGGGSIDDNIERWTSQFATADGKPVRPVVRRSRSGRMPITSVELRGTYSRGVGMGPGEAAIDDQMLIVFVVETPKGNLTFQLWGPSETVKAHRGGIEAMARGLTLATPA